MKYFVSYFTVTNEGGAGFGNCNINSSDLIRDIDIVRGVESTVLGLPGNENSVRVVVINIIPFPIGEVK